MNPALTHRLAVNAYLIYNDKFLLLKRNTDPLLWGPPGGRLEVNEDPVKGLKREIMEETGLKADIHFPVTSWFGILHGGYLLSIDYLATCTSNKVILSAEHNNFIWLTIDELYKDRQSYFDSATGFNFWNFDSAWKSYILFIE